MEYGINIQGQMMWYKRYSAVLLFCLCVTGAEVIELDEHSSGQLVCSRSYGLGTPCVMIYRKPGKGQGKWLCQELYDSTLRECNGASYKVLPMTEQIQPWELTTYCINMLKSKGTPVNEAVANMLLDWKGGERGVDVRRCLSLEKGLVNGISFWMKRCFSKKKKERDLAIDEIRSQLESCKLLDELNTLMGKGDFYAVVTFEVRLKKQVLEPLKGHPSVDVIGDIFAEWEGIILREYLKASDGLQGRYISYHAVFPKNPYVVYRRPVSFSELQKMCFRSYEGYKVTREKSSFCDFEEWGGAMLAVLQSLPGNNEAALHFGEEYDQALSRYQEYLKKTGK